VGQSIEFLLFQEQEKTERNRPVDKYVYTEGFKEQRIFAPFSSVFQ
jgi:hypothetical protein